MTELRFEARLRRWALEHGHAFERLRYPRPAAGGETTALRVSPARPRGVLTLVHGTGNDALFALAGFIRQAVRRGLEVFTFDIDGHGREGTSRFGIETVRSAVPVALERALDGRSLPLHAWGISLGGSLLLDALASGNAGAVERAVVVSAPTRLRVTARAVLAELSWRSLRAALAQRSHAGPWEMVPAFGPFKRSTYPVRLAAEGGAFGYLGAVSELVDALELPARAENIGTPVLLVYGSRDRVVPPRQGEELAARMPRARLLRVERGTHLTTFYSDDVESRCLEWMEGPPPR